MSYTVKNRSKKIRRAKRVAENSNAETFRHGAIITKKGRFIAGAHNIVHKTDPQGSGHFQAAHAEVRTIKKARSVLKRLRPGDDLSDCEIFVLRINKSGEIKLSKPCPCCMRLIEKYGLTVDWSKKGEKHEC